MSNGSCYWDTAERKQRVEPEVEQLQLSLEADKPCGISWLGSELKLPKYPFVDLRKNSCTHDYNHHYLPLWNEVPADNSSSLRVSLAITRRLNWNCLCNVHMVLHPWEGMSALERDAHALSSVSTHSLAIADRTGQKSFLSNACAVRSLSNARGISSVHLCIIPSILQGIDCQVIVC